MSKIEQVDSIMQRSFEQIKSQQYQTAEQIMKEALTQAKRIEGGDGREVVAAVEEELRVLEQIIKELNRIRSSPEDVESSADTYSPAQQPYQPRQDSYARPAYRVTAAPRHTDNRSGASRSNQPSSSAHSGAKQPSYAKPWQQNMKSDQNKKSKPKTGGKDDLPSSYEGVEPRFAEEIHAAMIRNSTTTYDDVAGLEEVKRLLDEAITYPLQMPELFAKLATWRGVLLYGPPGCGKTEIAKAVANKANCCFFAASASTIMSKYVGESEKMVKALFTIARYHAPSIIFLDEVDAIMNTGSSNSENPVGPRLRQEILTQMQGVGTENDSAHQVLVLAATNHPWNLDQAMIRRLEKRIYLPLPELVSRRQILSIKLKDQKLDEDVNLDEIAGRLDGYSGADIDVIVRDARMQPMRRIGYEELLKNKQKYIEEGISVTKEDFDKAIQGTKPSVTPEHLTKYVEFQQKLGSV